MLFPTAGARLFIADTPSEIPSEGWVEVGETEALGSLGGRYDLVEVTSLDGDSDGYDAIKGSFRPDPMQVVLGLDPTDAGQLLLLKAYRHDAPFPFRLLFADGETNRRWLALVTSFNEVFDSANNVMRMQVELQPVAHPQR